MSAAQRTILHERGREQMFRGEYYEALITFRDALDKQGPHVGLISDLIAVLSGLGRTHDCNSMMTRLQGELEKAKPFLKPDSIARTIIFMGKIREDQAEAFVALDNYKMALQTPNISDDVRTKAAAQLLRLQSYLGLRSNLAEFYRECLKYKTQSFELNIELEHSLILAEIVLFGVSIAEERLQTALQNSSVRSYDKRLMFFDFLEESLRQGFISSITSLFSLVDAQEADDFELVALRFSSDPTYFFSPTDYIKYSGSISSMNLMRLIILNLKRLPTTSLRVEFKRLLSLLLETVSADSRNLLIKKWSAELGQAETVLLFHQAERKLRCGEQEVLLKKNSFAEKCVTLFTQKETVTVDEFVAVIFESEADSSYMERTRMALTRLNKELAVLSGSMKIFSISKTHVELQSGVRIHSA